MGKANQWTEPDCDVKPLPDMLAKAVKNNCTYEDCRERKRNMVAHTDTIASTKPDQSFAESIKQTQQKYQKALGLPTEATTFDLKEANELTEEATSDQDELQTWMSTHQPYLEAHARTSILADDLAKAERKLRRLKLQAMKRSKQRGFVMDFGLDLQEGQDSRDSVQNLVDTGVWRRRRAERRRRSLWDIAKEKKDKAAATLERGKKAIKEKATKTKAAAAKKLEQAQKATAEKGRKVAQAVAEKTKKAKVLAAEKADKFKKAAQEKVAKAKVLAEKAEKTATEKGDKLKKAAIEKAEKAKKAAENVKKVAVEKAKKAKVAAKKVAEVAAEKGTKLKEAATKKAAAAVEALKETAQKAKEKAKLLKNNPCALFANKFKWAKSICDKIKSATNLVTQLKDKIVKAAKDAANKVKAIQAKIVKAAKHAKGVMTKMSKGLMNKVSSYIDKSITKAKAITVRVATTDTPRRPSDYIDIPLLDPKVLFATVAARADRMAYRTAVTLDSTSYMAAAKLTSSIKEPKCKTQEAGTSCAAGETSTTITFDRTRALLEVDLEAKFSCTEHADADSVHFSKIVHCPRKAYKYTLSNVAFSKDACMSSKECRGAPLSASDKEAVGKKMAEGWC